MLILVYALQQLLENNHKKGLFDRIRDVSNIFKNLIEIIAIIILYVFILQKIHVCETIGGANVICPYKIGTLSMNIMIVRKLITYNERIEINPTTELDRFDKKRNKRLA